MTDRRTFFEDLGREENQDTDCLLSILHPGDGGDFFADLVAIREKHGREVAWRIYLERVLPHLYRFRHLLPRGVFICPQSIPKDHTSVLLIEARNEISKDLPFRNYEQHFRGRRYVSFSFLESGMLADDAQWHEVIKPVGKVDVLVISHSGSGRLPPATVGMSEADKAARSTKTADSLELRFVAEANAGDCATAYVLPHECLALEQCSGAPASICREDSAGEAVIETIRTADVVIGFSEQTRSSCADINKRYVQCEGSVPPLCTTSAVGWSVETGIMAARLHRRTRRKRLEDGRPLVAFFFPCISGTGGGEIQLWRRMEVARGLGINPFVVISRPCSDVANIERVSKVLEDNGIEYEFLDYYAFFSTPYGLDVIPKSLELEALRSFFKQNAHRISLVHSLAIVPGVGMVCSEFGIPHLASIYGIDDNYEFPGGRLPFKYCDIIQSDSIRYARKWSDLLGCEWVCAREMAPESLFEIGFNRLYVNPQPMPHSLVLSVVGTFMERKSQLEAIQSLRFLDRRLLERIALHFFGNVDTYPEYGRECRNACMEVAGPGGSIVFHGHVTDVSRIYAHSDIVLSVSTFESFPSAIKEATASGCLVIASKAGGIGEMMVDGVNCFLVEDPTPQGIAGAVTRAACEKDESVLDIRRNAYALACDEFHPRRALHDLALCYTTTLACAGDEQPCQGEQPERRSNLEFSTDCFRQAPLSYVLVGRGLSYSIKPRHPHWTGIDILVGTHGTAVEGTLTLQVMSENGQVLRRATCSLDQVQDNSWVRLRFLPINYSRDLLFGVRIGISKLKKRTCVSLYETNPPENPLRRLLRRMGFKLSGNLLYCRLWYTRTLQ